MIPNPIADLSVQFTMADPDCQESLNDLGSSCLRIQ